MVMAFAPVEKMQIKNAVEKALHAPGNYAGSVLEMALVFDCSLSEGQAKEAGRDIAALLKSHSEIFRNVRLNRIYWEGDGSIGNGVISLPHLQMGGGLEGYRCIQGRKRAELLAGYLKKFQARSKLILLVTDGNCLVEDEELFRENMHPFLYRKFAAIRLYPDKEKAGCRTVSIHMGMEKGWMADESSSV
jgi:hypothetical protein